MKDAARIGVYGGSGSGKSTHVKEFLKTRARVIVFDPLGEYAALRGYARVAPSPGEGQLLAALKAGWARGFRIAYVPRAMREAVDLHRLAQVVKGAQAPYFAGRDARQLTLVVEEMNLSFPVTSLPAELYGFAELCSRGRHYGVEIVGVSQRLAEVNTRFRGNAEIGVFFPLGANPRDAAVAVSLLGPRHRDQLLRLRPHEFLRLDHGAVVAGRNSIRTGRKISRKTA